ncbi:MAG: riboflavin synthase [Kiritimatiellaceae bacterium]|nr:riboflavin synthase [Kiritimatiellaceae bacterium]
MFTGIIQRVGEVLRLERDGEAGRLVIAVEPAFDRAIELGESIAVNGTCLTVAGVESGGFVFDVLAETFDKTSLGALEPGGRVNLELALAMGDPLGGHLVTGHVDETGRVLAIEQVDRDWKFRFGVSDEMLPLLVKKGSIAIDGTSLTVAELHEDGFSVHIIPHTFAETLFGVYAVGRRVNLEADLLGKYVQRIMEHGGASVYRGDGAS